MSDFKVGDVVRYVGRSYPTLVGQKVVITKIEEDVPYPIYLGDGTPVRPDELDLVLSKKHSHYYKDVSTLDEIDVYKVCELFEVDDSSGCVQHAIKKLLCGGKRGTKSSEKDLQEAVDTLQRKIELGVENESSL